MDLNRRAGKFLWLALVAGCCVGGWISGRAFVGDRKGTAEVRIKGKRHDRSAEMAFAAGSPRGNWMERVRKAGAGDFPKLMGEMETVFEEGYNGFDPLAESAMRWFYAMWLVKDRDGFRETVFGTELNYSYWAAQALVAVDPEWAAELLRDGALAKKSEYLAESIARALAEQNPSMYLSINPDGNFIVGDYQSDDWEKAIISLAKTDALAAANAWLERKLENNSSTFCDSFFAIAEGWKAGDGSLPEWVDAIPDPRLRNLAHHMRVSAMAKEDPHAALAELYRAKLEDDNDIIGAPSEVLTQLAKADPKAALNLLKDLEKWFSTSGEYDAGDPFATEPEVKSSNPFHSMGPGRYSGGNEIEDNGVRYAVLRALAKDLPDDPALFWEKLQGYRAAMGGDSDWQRGVEAGLIRGKSGGWSAIVCLEIATRWAVETGGATDDETYRNLAKRAATLSPGAVIEALAQLPEAARGLFAAEAIKRFPADNAEQRIGLLRELPAEKWDKDLGESLGRNAAEYAAVIAALPGQGTAEARKAFASGWADDDPEAAAKWTESLPDDGRAKETASALVDAWAAYDGYAASEWVATLPAGFARDGAAAALVGSISRMEPESAWQWAATISDPLARSEALTDVENHWRRESPPELREQIIAARLAAGLPDKEVIIEEPEMSFDDSDPFAEQTPDPFAEQIEDPFAE